MHDLAAHERHKGTTARCSASASVTRSIGERIAIAIKVYAESHCCPVPATISSASASLLQRRCERNEGDVARAEIVRDGKQLMGAVYPAHLRARGVPGTTTHGPLRINVAFHGELITRNGASRVPSARAKESPSRADSPTYSSTKSL